MLSKRSRIGRSSSFRKTDMMSPPPESAEGWMERRATPPSAASVKLPSTSAKAMKSAVAEKSAESRPRILTMSSPVQESVYASDKVPIGGFLEKCCYCKEQICENAEVFMYSYLRAFCSAECRDGQIAIDSEMEKASRKSKGMQLNPSG